MPRFEPDQLVLVREGKRANWDLARYSYCDTEAKGHVHHIQGLRWFRDDDVLPYSGNEHLLGTTDAPTPKWEPKPGELVAVRHSSIEEWKVRVFRYHDNDNGFACDNERERAGTCFWHYCEPLRKHFTIPE